MLGAPARPGEASPRPRPRASVGRAPRLPLAGRGPWSRWPCASRPTLLPRSSSARTNGATPARGRRDLDDGFLAIHPGSGSPAKNWPAERFAEAARRLSGGRPWLLLRGPAEEESAAWPGAVVAREWPLRPLGAALSRAGLVLGNDSGVAHLAAASGAPTLTLFGPTDPALWAPVGRSVATVRAPGGALRALDVDAVVAAALAVRSAGPPSGPPSG